MSKTYTISTRIQKTDGTTEYFEPLFIKYSSILRTAFKDVQKYPMSDLKSASNYQYKYAIDARTANSILRTANGYVNSLKELKKYELTQLKHKFTSLKKRVVQKRVLVENQKERARNNQLSDLQLEKYRREKANLYQLSQKLNRYNQKLSKLQTYIENNEYRAVFGTKELYKKQHLLEENSLTSHQKWLNIFRKHRDKNITYIGAKNETCCNQNFQMTYNEDTDSFNLKIRKDLDFMENPDDKYLYINNVKLNYQKELIIDILENKNSSLTYRINRKGTKYYLQIMFTLTDEMIGIRTYEKEGTIGLDYNKGFIQLCETNKEGNIIHFEKIKLRYHGTGNRSKSEIERKLSKIVKYALNKRKDIIIEDLNFGKKKSSIAKSVKNKKLNKMIHTFDYSRYKETIGNIGFRTGVRIAEINPYNTSNIGEEKYSKIKGINRHQAASYVIARIGQGFIDKV